MWSESGQVFEMGNKRHEHILDSILKCLESSCSESIKSGRGWPNNLVNDDKGHFLSAAQLICLSQQTNGPIGAVYDGV